MLRTAQIIFRVQGEGFRVYGLEFGTLVTLDHTFHDPHRHEGEFHLVLNLMAGLLPAFPPSNPCRHDCFHTRRGLQDTVPLQRQFKIKLTPKVLHAGS